MALIAPERVLLTVEEAAAALAIGRSKCYQIIAAKHLPIVHIGRSARVPARAVSEFAERLASGEIVI